MSILKSSTVFRIKKLYKQEFIYMNFEIILGLLDF